MNPIVRYTFPKPRSPTFLMTFQKNEWKGKHFMYFVIFFFLGFGLILIHRSLNEKKNPHGELLTMKQ